MQSRARDTLTVWTEESGHDTRNTRWAVIAAVAVHALFFCLELPESVAADHRPAKPQIFLVRTVRFEPPPVREQQPLPERSARRMPMPDPTPDDPEPLLGPVEPALAVDFRNTDLVLDLPAAPPPEPPTGPLRVGGDVLPPVKLYSPPPRYTEIARKARIQGVVFIEAVIDATGEVTRVKLIRGLPMGLDQTAIDAVRTWRFEPATYNGKPVPVLYNLTINFKLT